MSADDLRGFRLSPQQRRAWSLWRGEGNTFGARCAVALDGEVDPERLEGALRQVVTRHEILRTAYHRLPGMRFPVQVPSEDGVDGWLDWRAAAGSVEPGDKPLRELLAGAEGGDGAFDVARGPALRGRLHRGAGRHLLLLELSPLAADGAALDVLVRDLAAAYRGEEIGASPVRYVQFAEWQCALLEGDEDAEGREFWRRPEVAEAAELHLPFELPESRGADAFAPPSVACRLGGSAEDRLLAACWYAVLARAAGVAELTVAHPHTGREHELFEDAVGLFARWVPVPARPRPGRRLRELAAEVGESVGRAREWGGAYDAGDAAGGGAAAFEVESRPAVPESAGVRFRIAGKRVCFERFRLRLACTHDAGDVRAELHFDASRIAAADAERLLAQWRRAVLAGIANPEIVLANLDLLGEDERRRLVVELNRTAADTPRDACVHHLFEAQARRTPEAPAVTCEGRSLTYAELDCDANRLAHRLRRAGVGPEVLVALCLERSLEFLVAVLGVLKAGGAYVPIEPWQPLERLAMMLDDAAPPVTVVEAGLAQRLGAYPGTVVRIDADRDELDAESGAPPAPTGVTASNLAYVIFTSGSTGRPKGVAVEHRQLVNYVSGAIARLGLGDLPAGSSYASVSTFAADLGHTVVFPSLATGGCLHVVSLARLADARRVGDYFQRHGIDCLKVVPSHLEALSDQPEPDRVIPRRRLILGGESSRPRLVAELQRRAPECAIFNHYGPSETTVGVLVHRVEPEALDPRCATVPLGRPIANARVYLLDPAHRPVPPWTAGELYVGGACVSRGYLGRPGLTAERFLPDGFAGESGASGGRLYRTGDLGRHLPDGSVEFLGRADEQVKYHGFRVELNELRLALNAIDGVRDSVVRLVRDDAGRDVLIAYYVSRHEIEIGILRQALGRSVLEETIPNLFVHLKRLPLTLNGKVNYDALPGLDEARRMVRREIVEPRTAVEETMARIWAQVLGHEKVSVHDNFFELGGHSLLATRVISRQREALGVEIPLRSLFDAPTVAGLAAIVEGLLAGGGGAAGPDLVREKTDLDSQLAELEELSNDEASRLFGEAEGASDREALGE